jgi:hypothetical protein
MLKHSVVSGLSELGDGIETTTYRNVPFRECSKCPMLFINAWDNGDSFCAYYGERVDREKHGAPKYCKIIEVVVKEKFEK